MKTYEEALSDVVGYIRMNCGDYRTASRFAAFTTLSIVYNKTCNDVYADASKIEESIEAQDKLTRKLNNQERHKQLREERSKGQ